MTEEFTAHYRLPIPQFNSVPWHLQWESSLRAVDEALYLSTVAHAPAWQNSTEYFIGSMVLDTAEGTLWICTTPHTSPAAPVAFSAAREARPEDWQGVTAVPTFRGVWAPDTTYNNNDFVISGTKYAVATASHISSATFAADETAGLWEVLIDTGVANPGINNLPPAALPAAATVDLGSVLSSRINITGTFGNITSLGASINTLKIVTIGANGNTLKQGASMSMPGAVDLVVYSGDVVLLASNNVGTWASWGLLRWTDANTFNDIKQPADTINTGVVRFATNAETLALGVTNAAVTPSNLGALNATTTQEGLIATAQDAEAVAKTSVTKALTPSNLAALTPTTAASGLIELATSQEVRDLVDGVKAITPATLGTCDATETQQGITQLASNAEVNLGTSTTKVVTPAGLKQLQATGAVEGLTRYATNPETLALSETKAAVTPNNLGALLASTTQKGIIELADDTETGALVAAARAVTPASLGSLTTTTTQRGIHRFATAGEAQAGSLSSVGLTPSNLTDIIATKAQVEAEAVGRVITSTNAQYIPGAAKAYATAGSTDDLLFAYNVSGVVDSAVGVIQIQIDASMSNTVYPTAAMAMQTSGTNLNVVALNAPSVGAVTLRCYDQAGALTDPARWYVAIHGTRA